MIFYIKNVFFYFLFWKIRLDTSACVAQLVVRSTCNRKAGGSNPLVGIFLIFLYDQISIHCQYENMFKSAFVYAIIASYVVLKDFRSFEYF